MYREAMRVFHYPGSNACISLQKRILRWIDSQNSLEILCLYD